MGSKSCKKSEKYKNFSAALIKIDSAKNQLGLDDITYQSVLLKHGGVEDAQDLTPSGINNVLKHFESLGADIAQNEVSYRKRTGTDKAKQLKLLQDLFAGKTKAWDHLI